MKHTNLLYIVGLTIFLVACSGPEAPSFQGLKDLKVKSANLHMVNLVGKAVYNNPNAVGGSLTYSDVKIKVNDVLVTHAVQNESISIPASSEFEVPIDLAIDLDKLKEAKGDGKLLDAFSNVLKRNILLEYEGYVTVKLAGISVDIPVDYKEKVDVGLLYAEAD